MNGRSWHARLYPRCAKCGCFVSPETHRPLGWFRYGEHGTEEGWICRRCLPGWTPSDGRGRGPEAGYCGVKSDAR